MRASRPYRGSEIGDNAGTPTHIMALKVNRCDLVRLFQERIADVRALALGLQAFMGLGLLASGTATAAFKAGDCCQTYQPQCTAACAAPCAAVCTQFQT